MNSLRIIHASARFVVVDKPPGLLSVPGKPVPGGPDNQDCVAARVRALFPAAHGPLIAHRLDMETSGLMVLGLDPAAQRDLSMQFEQRRVEKSYTALVAGSPAEPSGRITLSVRPDIDNRPRQIVDLEHGRDAVTEWSVAGKPGDITRLRLLPLTGRTHQLRIHLSHPRGLGMPILGDKLYGGPPAPRLMLHATTLGFHDPDTGAAVAFESVPAF